MNIIVSTLTSLIKKMKPYIFKKNCDLIHFEGKKIKINPYNCIIVYSIYIICYYLLLPEFYHLISSQSSLS